ncbi:MAG: exosortase O [Microcoleus sp.]
MSSGIMQRADSPKSGVNLVWLAPLLLTIAWFLANISAVKWLLSSVAEISTIYKILTSVVIVALTARSIGNPHRAIELLPNLVLRRYPLLLMLGAGILSIALQCIIDIKQVTVLLFILGTYGLCGLFSEPNFWRKNLPIAGLLACILPFNSQFNSGLGLPARVLTAQVVEQLLSALQIKAISSYDIIVLENGIAHVDVPCSGIKTLLVGTLFLLAATWLEGRQLGLRWLAVCAANLLMLVSANTARIAVLVVVSEVFKQQIFAQIIHVPLGIVGLVCACFVTWLMLQRVPKIPAEKASDISAKQNSEILKNQPLAKPGLIAAVTVLAVISQLSYVETPKMAIAPLRLPANIKSESIPLNPSEQKFFGNYPGTQTEKRRFVVGNLRGSMLTVASTSWQTYHAPELCFLASGISVDRLEIKQLTSAVIARWLSLKNHQLSAAYWLQSPQLTTDNFMARIGRDITQKNHSWVLVSILFDSYLNPESYEVKDFASNVHDAIKQSLTGEINENQTGI